MDYKVRVDDINYGKHLGNERLLLIAQQARIEFFQSIGYRGEIDFGDDIGIIMSDAAIEFKAEAFMGDQLRVDLAVSGSSHYGFDMFYRLTRRSDDKLIGQVKTGILFMNYHDRKLVAIPREVLDKIRFT